MQTEKSADSGPRSDIWARLLTLLGGELSSVAIDTWFDECSIAELSPGELILHTPMSLKRDAIEAHFIPAIKNALEQLLPGEYAVRVFDDEGLRAHMNLKKEREGADDEYTFERFVVGTSNKFAQAAALAVATGRAGRDYNPLFIYGDSGLGKTHLLRAIRNTIGKAHPDYKIVYVKGDDFTNELIQALQVGRNIAFREKYRYANVFLVDDIHFIAGKNQTQEEFFHTFNTLHDAGRQIVLTSDRPPREIARLEDRLKTRFECGLLADISPPDYETRMAIIRNKATELCFRLPDDVAAYIADNMSANIRQLEGAVKKMKVYGELYGERGLTVQEAARQIKDLLRESERAITADLIIEETAKYFILSPEDLKGPKRMQTIAHARQISQYLIRTMMPKSLSLTKIGEIFDGRDHTTILNGVRNIENAIKNGGEAAQSVKDITSNIQTRVENAAGGGSR
ncbi:MAG: chromosomal replication initiator protein DnaA [Oscillospiraceae bacterium]|jgi:chromosomal replication initiator protein|nr:chromosomal replication initiator protein DnaA [Oscillospiraceae bacterium]